MSAAASVPSLIPLLVVVAMRRAEARIHRQLAEASALTPETAIALSFARSIDRRRLQGLVRNGAVREAAGGRHYLDATGWGNHQRNRRRRVLLALSVVVALLGIGVAVAFLMR